MPASLAEVRSLTSLKLARNRLRALPEWLARLTNLTSLDVSDNSLGTLPEWLARLTNLTSLDLGRNEFDAIPDVILRMEGLESLSFSNQHLEQGKRGNRIVEVPAAIGALRALRRLDLSENPVETPPLEVVHQGIEAIRAYYQQLEEGIDHLYEAKLLIVGEGGAGKTTLARKIKDLGYRLDAQEPSTKGIDVTRWDFPTAQGHTFRRNVWDFGGQEIYHATHQFFLTKRSLYILVADARREDTDFYYWLNVVALLGGKSPLLTLLNEKQDRHREINERQMYAQFANFRDTLRTNLATNRGLDRVRDAIRYYSEHLEHVGTALPKTWVKVREALESDPCNYIGVDEFLAICTTHGFTRREDKLQLSSYLHDLGVCLHFQDDPILKKLVILKPKWGTDAVYKVLDNKQVISHGGKFGDADLHHIWSDAEYAGMEDELLQLMIKFGLCYRIGTSDRYIAPQLLSEAQPAYEWDDADNLILRYTYVFMPRGIVSRLIVALHPLIEGQQNVWKSGVILRRSEARAEIIEYYGRREIRIRVSGKGKKELLTIISYEFERIHGSLDSRPWARG